VIVEFEAKLIPPSMNAYWRSVCRNGRPIVYLSKKGSEFKKALSFIAKSKIKEPFATSVVVSIEYFTTGAVGKDIDNILKPILDAMNGVVYVDDKQIEELRVLKFTKCKENKLVIKVFERF
jgi:Holliday junction resolvase RusA-like endonuclease